MVELYISDDCNENTVTGMSTSGCMPFDGINSFKVVEGQP